MRREQQADVKTIVQLISSEQTDLFLLSPLFEKLCVSDTKVGPVPTQLTEATDMLRNVSWSSIFSECLFNL